MFTVTHDSDVYEREIAVEAAVLATLILQKKLGRLDMVKFQVPGPEVTSSYHSFTALGIRCDKSVWGMFD